MRRTKRTTFVAALVAALSMLLATVALADILYVNELNTGTPTGGSSSTKAPGSSGSLEVWLAEANNVIDGDKTGCAAGTVTVVLTSNNAGVTFDDNTKTLSDCGVASATTFTYNVSLSATGSAVITAEASGAKKDNVIDDTDTFTVNISAPSDTTGPSVSCAPSVADGVWHASNQEVVCTATDPSGLHADTPSPQTLSTSVTSGSEDSNASTGTYVFKDVHGNQTTAGPIAGWKVDRKAPTIATTGATTDPNGAGWYNTDVTVGFTAEDLGSGLGTFVTPFQQTTSGEGSAVTVGSGAVADAVGNNNPGINSAAFQIDKTKPTSTVGGFTNGDPFILGDEPTPTCTGDDTGGSGVASHGSPSATGGPLGTVTVTCNGATDVAGNTQTAASAAKTYKVGVNYTGFSAPVDKAPWVNKAKAGKAVPLKWRATDANGDPVTSLTNADVKILAVDLGCNTGSSMDLIEEYSADGGGLQNMGNGYYQFDWKTPTTYVNSCKTVTALIGGVSGPSANFTFTK